MATMHHIYKILGSFTIRNGVKGENVWVRYTKNVQKKVPAAKVKNIRWYS